MIRVADYIIERIYNEGVRSVFYVPGGQCVYLTDALRRKEDMHAVAVHHEQAAAMGALTYSLLSDNIGACLVTTGCAGTNTMTGLLHAWQDSIPCIFVSGQQNYDQTVHASGLPLRQVGVQEADIETIAKPITKYAVTIESENDVVYEIDKAIYYAREGRPGPVWIDVPLNIQNAMINVDKMIHFDASNKELIINSSDIQYVMEGLKKAKRPIVLAGHGIRCAYAIEELRAFINNNQLPVVFSRFSSDLMPFESEYNMGIVSGIAGASRYGNFAIQNSDFVLSIGCRLSIDTTGPDRESFAREAEICVVDIDKIEHSKKGVKIDRFIHGDAKSFLAELNKCRPLERKVDWMSTCNHWKDIFSEADPVLDSGTPIDAKYVIRKISGYMPEGSVVISDAGFTGAAVPANIKNRKCDRIIHSFAQGEMGYSLPGACGAAELTEKPIVSFTGDGSFMMNLQELQTVVRNRYNIKIIIISNNGYSGVRHGQQAHFRGKTIGTDSGNGVDFPDYGKIAEAFGINYCKIKTYAEIDTCLHRVFENDSPFVCEVITDPDQFDLHNALVTYGKRKYGFRPIEDQSPFIERDVFFEEMIIEPMETSYGTPV